MGSGILITTVISELARGTCLIGVAKLSCELGRARGVERSG